jgi:hypothetical protein
LYKLLANAALTLPQTGKNEKESDAAGGFSRLRAGQACPASPKTNQQDIRSTVML